METLVLANSRGRVLFEALQNERGSFDVTHDTGGGSSLPMDQVFESAHYLLLDAPSCKASGTLAEAFNRFVAQGGVNR